MPKPILIFFGGVSAEHEVSVITGLQVLETIDTALYEPHTVYIDKKGNGWYIPGLKDRQAFLTAPRKAATFGKDTQGGYMQVPGWSAKKIYPYAAYLGTHGGNGESGPLQGLLELFDIPFTSPGLEASVLMMNKQLTKEVVARAGVGVVPGISLMASEIKEDIKHPTERIIRELSLPVIIKPVHLGSSIGIKIARSEVELQKYLLEATFIDNEILVEKFLSDFTEYNCAVRFFDGKLETSEIERPKSNDEILSFADKYQRGGKKTGGRDGMASLQREIPAKISEAMKQGIQTFAQKAFVACRGKGMVRIDFMVMHNGLIYLTEINPIPGSMAFYLWEASGISFKQQITDLIEQSIIDADTAKSTRLDYETDIIEKFTRQAD